MFTNDRESFSKHMAYLPHYNCKASCTSCLSFTSRKILLLVAIKLIFTTFQTLIPFISFLGVLLLVCFFKDTEHRYLARKDWNVRSQIDLFTMLKIKCIDLNSTFYLHLHFLQNQNNMFICFMLANALQFLIL